MEYSYDSERKAMSEAKRLLEEKLGRKIRNKEYAYSKDGDIFNLEIENLELITPKDSRSIYFEEDEERQPLNWEVLG